MNPLDTAPKIDALRDYTATKLSLAEQFRIIRNVFKTLNCNDSVYKINELLGKLAEDRFTLAVLGQFKRGKSTLMNAIIGQELLPTGVLPLTSAITILRYGTEQKLQIQYRNSIFSEEVEIDRISEFVTEEGNSANQKQVKCAFIELPLPFLYYGLEFVDTPGVGSSSEVNTETTYEFLPQCDAAIFVTGAESPITSAELQFLKDIFSQVHSIFVVVNKIDLLGAKQREELITYITSSIHKNIFNTKIIVIPVSAKKGINAKINHNHDLYNESGIKELEEKLAEFLAIKKYQVLLSNTVRSIYKIIDEEITAGTFTYAHIGKQQIVQNNEPSNFEDLSLAIESITSAQKSIQEIMQFSYPHAEIRLSSLANITTPLRNNLPSYRIVPIDIKLDLLADGCPVCNYLSKQAFEFFSDWQYQLSISEKVRIEFADEHGFCSIHTWQLAGISSPLGISIGFPRLIERVSNNISAMKDTLPNEKKCRVCQILNQSREEYLSQLSIFLNNEDGRNAYSYSSGLCLIHLHHLLKTKHESILYDLLINHTKQKLMEDAKDLRTFALKSETLHKSLISKREKESYTRAINRLSGISKLSLPWTLDEDRI